MPINVEQRHECGRDVVGPTCLYVNHWHDGFGVGLT